VREGKERNRSDENSQKTPSIAGSNRFMKTSRPVAVCVCTKVSSIFPPQSFGASENSFEI
jgi:hypothetical protein